MRKHGSKMLRLSKANRCYARLGRRPHQPTGDAESFKIKKIQNPEIVITKTEVIKTVTESLKGGHLGREDVRMVINQTLDMITQSLVQGCRVRFDGFGSWRMLKKRNPYH